MKGKFLLGTIIATTLIALFLWGSIEHRTRLEETAAIAAEKLKVEREAAGLREALLAKPKEIVKLVPTLVTKEVTRLIHDKKIEPVAAATVEAKKDVIVALPETEEAAKTVALHLQFNARLLVTRVKFGIATDFKADADGSIGVGDMEPQHFRFEEGETHFEVAFSEDIAKALRDHEAEGGWLKRHTALACPGVGLAINPFDGRVSGAITCSYSLVFF